MLRLGRRSAPRPTSLLVRTRARPRQLEDAEQIALMGWALHVRVGSWKLSELLRHCPNCGARTKAQAGRFKAMGVKAGVPDLQLPMRNSDYIGGYWELKVGENKLTPAQINEQELLRELGHHVATFWDWKACAEDMICYLRRTPYTVHAAFPAR